ncbi:MAG: rane protein [Pseudonocardiales bacterium]|nr:rane protein [Pseudonocardiales bacterium]
MSAMGMVSVRNLKAHRVRLLLTVVSVMLGTAFVAGSFVFTDTLKSSFDKIFTTVDAGVDARVQPKHSYDPGVPQDLVTKIQAVPGVRTVEVHAGAPIVLVDSRGKKVQPGGAPSEGGMWTPAAQSVGTLPTFAAGRAPTRAGEVAINSGAATKGHLTAGDRAKVVLPNAGVVDVTVVGVYKTKVETGGYIGVLFSRPQALELFTDGKHVGSLDIAAAAGVSEKTLAANIAHTLPSTLEVRTGTQARTDDQGGIQTALSFINYILLGFGFIALIVGTFIIYNTFSMIVAQRLRELALLRAIGAGRKQVRRSVLVEAGVIGVIGSALGLAGGIGLAFGLHSLLDALNLGLPSGGLVMTPRTVIVALVLGTGVTLLSANAPARRAAQVPPVAAMREEFASTSAASLRRRTVLGTVVAALGAVVTVAGVTSSSAGTGASLLGLGLVGVAAGAMMLSPVLAGWIITPLGTVIGRPFGAVGRLARTNAVRNPRRTAATAFALTLGLLLVSGIAVVGASMKASISGIVDSTVRADYILGTQSSVDIPPRAAIAASKVPGVGSTTELHNVATLVDGKHGVGTGVDGPLNAIVKVDMKHGGGTTTGHSMLVSSDTAKKNHWTIGSQHTLSVPGRTPAVETITGIYADNQLLGPWLVSGDVYRTLTPPNEQADIVILIRAAPGADLHALRTGLEQATNNFYVVTVQNRDEFKGQVAGQINGLLGLLYGLLGLAIVIAILGIINTLALSVVERRREIGMLRAVGMQRKQVRRTIYVESLLIAVFGAVLGLGLGIAYGSMFTRTLRNQGLDTLSVPWTQAVTFLVVAGIVGVLAALWPGIRAARTRPLEAIAAS